MHTLLTKTFIFKLKEIVGYHGDQSHIILYVHYSLLLCQLYMQQNHKALSIHFQASSVTKKIKRIGMVISPDIYVVPVSL